LGHRFTKLTKGSRWGGKRNFAFQPGGGHPLGAQIKKSKKVLGPPPGLGHQRGEKIFTLTGNVFCNCQRGNFGVKNHRIGLRVKTPVTGRETYSGESPENFVTRTSPPVRRKKKTASKKK